MNEATYDFGMVGLGVMGSNLLQNMAAHGFKVIGFDKDIQKTALLDSLASDMEIKGVSSLGDMVQQLEKPRKLMMLVPAGKPVDNVIESLLPFVEEGDTIIDGGNSHYTDTLVRVNYLQAKGIHFMGVGISGGEHGARTGPSIMPGGNKEAYDNVQPILEAIAAKVNGVPCTAYMGKHAAGHYVKMVHNGIEYAMMQIISEVYDLLKRGLDLNNNELHEIFKKWNEGELQSFLIEITAAIFLQEDEDSDNRLVDMILDKAGSKGTGKWTSQDAMDLPIAVPTIDAAVEIRNISDYKEQRTKAAALYKTEISKISADKEEFINDAGNALYVAFIIAYSQGLAMLQKASKELQMEIPLKEVVKIWRGGCIIRSALLDIFYTCYQDDPDLENILLNERIAKMIQPNINSLKKLISDAVESNIPAAGIMSVLTYFNAYSTGNLATNLIQAQRDYFGAHTYERIDKVGHFHTGWGEES